MEAEVREKYSVAVVGGVNMDICGQSAASLVSGDSNPGRISVRPGGVGRNIAHDLRLLGLEVSLLAAIGGDVFGAGVAESCRALGIDLSMALVLPQERSAAYLCVNDADGDMSVAVNDMDIVSRITPEYLAGCLEHLNSRSAVVLDANLSAETVDFLAENCEAPLYADPVSAIKAIRLTGALPRLRALKPNAMEAESLTGERDPEEAARALLRLGVERVFVSLGADGLIAAQGDRILHLPGERVEVVNTTGAGDAATAAIVWADLQAWGLEETARVALRAGALTCQAELPNSERLRVLAQ